MPLISGRACSRPSSIPASCRHRERASLGVALRELFVELHGSFAAADHVAGADGFGGFRDHLRACLAGSDDNGGIALRKLLVELQPGLAAGDHVASANGPGQVSLHLRAGRDDRCRGMRVALRIQLVELQSGVAVGKDVAGANGFFQFGLDLLSGLFGLGLCGGTERCKQQERDGGAGEVHFSSFG